MFWNCEKTVLCQLGLVMSFTCDLYTCALVLSGLCLVWNNDRNIVSLFYGTECLHALQEGVPVLCVFLLHKGECMKSKVL